MDEPRQFLLVYTVFQYENNFAMPIVLLKYSTEWPHLLLLRNGNRQRHSSTHMEGT
jgi:hypothetical protein